MRNTKLEGEEFLSLRTKSRGVEGDAKQEKVDDNGIDKMSTQMESEQNQGGDEANGPEKSKITNEGNKTKKKARASPALGTDKMKKEASKNLDCGIEWIKKRIGRDLKDGSQSPKQKQRLHFNKSVYEVEKKTDSGNSDIKQICKDLKDSFNLLYPTEMSLEHDTKLKKINGLSLFGDNQINNEDFKISKKDMKTPKQLNIIRTISPEKQKKLEDKKVSTKKLVLPADKDRIPSAMIPKSVHQKAVSYTDKKTEKFVSSVNKTKKPPAPKTSDRKMISYKTTEDYTKSRVDNVKTMGTQGEEMFRIPSIHRSFANYYIKSFIKSSP